MQADELAVELKAEKAPSAPPNAVDNDRLVLRVPWKKTPMKRRREIIVPVSVSPHDLRPIRAETRATLVASIARGRHWLHEIVAGTVTSVEQIAARDKCSIRQVNMTILLAFLAPELVKAAVEGRLPRGIGVTRLRDAPAEWSRQGVYLRSLGSCRLHRVAPEQNVPNVCWAMGSHSAVGRRALKGRSSFFGLSSPALCKLHDRAAFSTRSAGLFQSIVRKRHEHKVQDRNGNACRRRARCGSRTGASRASEAESLHRHRKRTARCRGPCRVYPAGPGGGQGCRGRAWCRRLGEGHCAGGRGAQALWRLGVGERGESAGILYFGSSQSARCPARKGVQSHTTIHRRTPELVFLLAVPGSDRQHAKTAIARSGAASSGGLISSATRVRRVRMWHNATGTEA